MILSPKYSYGNNDFCELCGKEGPTIYTKIENCTLSVCKKCSRFGIILDHVDITNETLKSKIANKTIRFSNRKDIYSSKIPHFTENTNGSQFNVTINKGQIILHILFVIAFFYVYFFNQIYPNIFKIFLLLAWLICSKNIEMISNTLSQAQFSKKFKFITLSVNSFLILLIIFFLFTPLAPKFDELTFLISGIPGFMAGLSALTQFPRYFENERDTWLKTGTTNLEIFFHIYSSSNIILSSLRELFLLLVVPFYGMAILFGSLVYGIEVIGFNLSVFLRICIFIFIVIPIIIIYIRKRYLILKGKMYSLESTIHEQKKKLELIYKKRNANLAF